MPNFKSPLGNKQFTGQPMREFDIPDESEQQYPEMAPVMRNRGPSMHGTQFNGPVDFNSINSIQQRLAQESVEDSAEIERQIKEAKQARRTGKERITDGAKRRIEMLVGMTRDTREVVLENNTFILQTLRSKEMRDAIMVASEYDGTVQFPFELRRQLLARALVQVAGVDIMQFIGSDTIEAKLEMVDDLPEPLLYRLYVEYGALVKDSGDKYAIKSAEEAQEVAEELKK